MMMLGYPSRTVHKIEDRGRRGGENGKGKGKGRREGGGEGRSKAAELIASGPEPTSSMMTLIIAQVLDWRDWVLLLPCRGEALETLDGEGMGTERGTAGARPPLVPPIPMCHATPPFSCPRASEEVPHNVIHSALGGLIIVGFRKVRPVREKRKEARSIKRVMDEIRACGLMRLNR
jgi:hypothetical protein